MKALCTNVIAQLGTTRHGLLVFEETETHCADKFLRNSRTLSSSANAPMTSTGTADYIKYIFDEQTYLSIIDINQSQPNDGFRVQS